LIAEEKEAEISKKEKVIEELNEIIS